LLLPLLQNAVAFDGTGWYERTFVDPKN